MRWRCGYVRISRRMLAVVLLPVSACAAQNPAREGTGGLEARVSLPDAPMHGEPTAAAWSGQTAETGALTGSISGVVTDTGGAFLDEARVVLVTDTADATVIAQASTDKDGGFRLAGLPAGSFVLEIEAKGFAGKQVHAVLAAGEQMQMSDLELGVATVKTDVDVTLTRQDIAQEQIEQQEKQRVFGVVPNFYVSYEKDPQPLTARQKYSLAWRTIIDPTSFLFTGIAAGAEQAANTYPGYGQGAAGYGRRYGAGFGDLVSGTMIGGAILPALLKQDPRYFYQGTGSIRSRAVHAISRSVLCRSDSGKTQLDYSGLAGGLAASGLSNLYYPAGDRNGAGLLFENLGIAVGTSAAANLFQEFLVKKLSRGVPKGANGSGP